MWCVGRWCQTDGDIELLITSQPSLGLTVNDCKEEKIPSEKIP